jgi:hypothetical protein
MLGLASTDSKSLSSLTTVNVFRQRGARLCAHIAEVPMGREAFKIDGVEFHRLMSQIQERRKAAPAGQCDDGSIGALHSEYSAVAAAETRSWLMAGAKGLPDKAPVFLFPRAEFLANPSSATVPHHAEGFFGLCDLPEMMALQCALTPDGGLACSIALTAAKWCCQR